MVLTTNTQQRLAAMKRSLPGNHVIGAIEDLHEAQAAVRALENAGSAAQDILLVPGETFAEDLQRIRQSTDPVRRALHVFFNSSDEGFPADRYLEHARRGHQVLHVYAPTAEKANDIAQVLSGYHVHQLRYFGRLTVTDFSDQ